ncbi:Putrescine transport system permease protein PotI [Propionispora sp. 2/2-37]|uniref:ABC transporter permease n=1 Tax=Propionispora sp. 2/2-37 TaxID=1677858 RepID=UPI0006BB7394|nr:ABC transporter permease subunit [Propionispora sp. 2/2-37]CUH96261.1 Putrescine transport system permease protein PotI [Propionispora sp. 2/2-37]
MKQKRFQWASAVYLFFGFLFLYAPIIMLVIFSFNDSKVNAVWTGFTFKWYMQLFSNQAVLEAAENSLIIALVSTVVAVMLGTVTAVGMYKSAFKGKGALDALLYIPIVIPEIVLGIALLALFSLFKISLGMLTLIIAHITFCLPFVVLVVRARIQGFDSSLEEAAMDLGANPWQTFMQVTFPIILPGIVAGALLALTLSLDDVIISFFVAGPANVTLPLKVFSMVRAGVSPEINALSTLLLVIVIPLALIAERLRHNNR